MSYTINKSDGTILANVPDGQINNRSSSLTLIGKNYSGFGEALNENFVKLLENFASASQPTSPIRGQIWFDTTENKLKVYSGTGFVPVSSATIANNQPATLGVGDLWFNDSDKQLYFYDGTSTILLGPSYSVSQGLSGLKVATILDKNNISRVVTYLYNNGTLLGIFAKDEFIPKLAITGFNISGEDKIIYPGFNAGSLAGIKFNVTATNAEKLDGADASVFARRNQANVFTQQLSIATNDGITFGDGFQGVLEVDVGNIILSNIASNRRMQFKVRKDADSETAIDVISMTREIKLYDGKADSVVSMGGSLIVQGNLTVNGETTTVNTTNISVEDKNINLANLATPTDNTADTGGIILKGTTDHQLVWRKFDAVLETNQARNAWNSTEHINLVATDALPMPEFKINGVTVLTENSLGPNIKNIPGVTEFGTQTVINVGPILPPNETPTAYLKIENNRISTLQVDQDLEIEPNGNGNISLIGTPKIVGLKTTNENSPAQTVESANVLSVSELSEATSKKYVTNLVRTRSIILTMDITDGPSNATIAGLLTQIAPPNEFENGTIARILCTAYSNSAVVVNLNPLLSKTNNIEYSTPTGTGFPLQDVAIAPATIPPASISVTRTVKTYQLVAGSWSFIA